MYNNPLYRPPSEANSLIIQVTEGCSHNKCRFCYMYKQKQFRVKQHDELVEHIEWLQKQYKNPRRIFLADGNVLCLKTEKILEILKLVKSYFPDVERISSYSGPRDILRKPPKELYSIQQAGLKLLYMGVESGSDQILKYMNKGVNQIEMIEAGCKAKEAGFVLSCMIISGLGGKELIGEHAFESAKVISKINPDYFSLLRLVVEKESELYSDLLNGSFELATPLQVLEENIIMLENIELENCIFRANHISNHVNLKGTLNKDKDILIEKLKNYINMDDFTPLNYDRL